MLILVLVVVDLGLILAVSCRTISSLAWYGWHERSDYCSGFRILNQTVSLYIASQVKSSMVMLLFSYEKSIAFAMQTNEKEGLSL